MIFVILKVRTPPPPPFPEPPIVPAKFLPYPAAFCILMHFFSLGLLITLVVKAVGTSEMSVSLHQTTKRSDPKDSLLHNYIGLIFNFRFTHHICSFQGKHSS
jgi:hypothetical protein